MRWARPGRGARLAPSAISRPSASTLRTTSPWAKAAPYLPIKPSLQVLIESFRDWGRDCWCHTGKDNTCGKRFEWQLGGLPCGYDHKYTYSHIGYNLKATDMQAALGVSQIDKLAAFYRTTQREFPSPLPGDEASGRVLRCCPKPQSVPIRRGSDSRSESAKVRPSTAKT